MAVTASSQSFSAARLRICCDARMPVNPKIAPRTNDLAVEALYMLVRPSVAIADALRYDLVERVLRLTGFVGFNGSVCFERLLIAGLGRAATDDCACSGCIGVDRVGVGFGCVGFIGSAAAGSGVNTVGRSVGCCASGNCSRCA